MAAPQPAGLSRLLSLYRAVLRVHRTALPPPLRALGDDYATAEFRRHLRGATTRAQWEEFGRQWAQYVNSLGGTGSSVSGDLPEEVWEAMSAEQRSQLALLREATQELGGTAARGAASPSGGRAGSAGGGGTAAPFSEP